MSGVEPLINVVRIFLDDSDQAKESQKRIDLTKYFEQNHAAIIQNVSQSEINQNQKAQILESLTLIESDPTKSFALYIWLMRKLISASNANVAEQFTFVEDKIRLLLADQLVQTWTNVKTLSQLSQCLQDFTSFCNTAKRGPVAIKWLLKCVQFASQDKISSLKTQFVKACWQNSFLQHTLPTIEQNLLDVVPGTSALDVINYYFYSGQIFLGMKRYSQAFRALERVMVTPTRLTNEIHVSAFKRLVLLSIIEGRDDYNLPSKTQDVLKHELRLGDGQLQTESIRGNQSNMVVYEQILNCAKTRSTEQIKTTIEQYMDHLIKDDTLELANLAADKLQERRVKELGDVYVTLGLQEIAQKVQLGPQVAVEQYLAKLINEKYLSAQINKETQTVDFREETDTLNLVQNLENQNKKIAELMQFANQLDVQIKTDEEFIKQKKKSGKDNENNSNINELDQQNAF